MYEEYAKLFDSELVFYQKIQDELDKLSATDYENLGTNPQILGSYQCIQRLQVEEAGCMAILMANETFKKENALFIVFIEKCLEINTLTEVQKYDLYSLIYKLSTVEPGQILLGYFVEHQSKIFIKPGNEPKSEKNLIFFPLQPDFQTLRVNGGTKPTRLISEVRHISLGHELIHLHHHFANIEPSLKLKVRIQFKEGVNLLYCEPRSPMITYTKSNEALTIDGEENLNLITENDLRRAFNLSTRLGWHAAVLTETERVKDLLTLIDVAHGKRSLSPEDFIRLTTPLSLSKRKVRSTTPVDQNIVAPSLVSSICSFFNDPHGRTTEKPGILNAVVRHGCTIL